MYKIFMFGSSGAPPEPPPPAVPENLYLRSVAEKGEPAENLLLRTIEEKEA